MLHNDLISQLCNIQMNEVVAVKTAEQRQQVEAHLLDYGQVYLDIWKLGINSFLRISDVLSLTMADTQAKGSSPDIIHYIQQATLHRSPFADLTD